MFTEFFTDDSSIVKGYPHILYDGSKSPESELNYYYPAARYKLHGNKFNAAYIDGHVASIVPNDIYTENDLKKNVFLYME